MTDWNKYYVSNDQVLALIKLYREEAPQNRAKILSSIMKQLNYLIQSKIKRFKNKLYYGDLLQEGKMGLLKAIEDFDPIRGINFFKFACWHIQHRIKMHLGWQKRNNRSVEGNYFGEEEYVENYEQLEVERIINKAIGNLPDIDKRVLTMRFGINGEEHQTLRQIGTKLSLSKQRIEQIEKRAICKLQNNIEIKGLNE